MVERRAKSTSPVYNSGRSRLLLDRFELIERIEYGESVDGPPRNKVMRATPTLMRAGVRLDFELPQRYCWRVACGFCTNG
jgi:hypothetical protein